MVTVAEQHRDHLSNISLTRAMQARAMQAPDWMTYDITISDKFDDKVACRVMMRQMNWMIDSFAHAINVATRKADGWKWDVDGLGGTRELLLYKREVGSGTR